MTGKTALQRHAPAPAVTFDEVRRLVAHDLPALSAPSSPAPAAGEYAATLSWISAAQGRGKPDLRHARIAIFAPGGADVAALSLALSPAAQAADADLKIYEISSSGPDFSEEEAAHAMAYGMMAVQPGLGLLVAAAADAEEPPREEAPLSFSALPLYALAGCVIAARLARVPVLLDGRGAETVAHALRAINPGADAHCRAVSAIPVGKTALPPGGQGAVLAALLKAVAVL